MDKPIQDSTVIPIKLHAQGRWPFILSSLGIQVRTDGRHSPCPACGGKDRFRFDNKNEKGTWFCNQCTPKAGDGFGLVMKTKNIPFGEALTLVAEVLGESVPRRENPIQNSEERNGRTGNRILRKHKWTDAKGNVAWKLRLEPKQFSWAQDADGKRMGRGECTPDLYQRNLVVEAHHVILCEGEGDVDTLNGCLKELGLYPDQVATCTPNGAGDVKEDYLKHLFQQSEVWLTGDNDSAGQRYIQKSHQILKDHVESLYILEVPNEHKDWAEWQEGGGTVQDLKALLDQKKRFTSIEIDPLRESNFAPLSAPDFIAEVGEKSVDWVLDDYLPRGGLVLWVAKPKTGKSTFVYQMAVAIAKGHFFLGRETTKGNVLILAVEEHQRDVRLRLQELGADQLPNIWVHVGPVDPTPTFFQELKHFITTNQIALVIIDTLATFWKLKDENDAGAMTQAVKPLLQLARESDACVSLNHHSRKSEGSHGDEIRGSSALFGLVDIAVIMKQHEIATQRKLSAMSRYPETPPELIVELRDGHYVSLGDPKTLDKKARLEKVKAALTDTPERVKVIQEKSGANYRDVERLLAWLADHDQATRTGKGVKNDPFLYQKCYSRNPPISIDANRISEDSTTDDFDSRTPPSPCANEKAEKVII